MATLTCLGSSYYYGQFLIASGDVADIITAVRAELLTRNIPAWTEPSANLFKSPVDAAGRWHDVMLTRIDQQTLEFRVRDQLGRTICTRRFQTGTAPFLCNIYSGQFHLIIENVSPGGNAALYSGILDQSPDAQGSHAAYVYGGGWLSATNTNDGYSSVSRCFMYDYGGAAYNDRIAVYGNSGTTACMYNQNGGRIYRPVETYVKYDSYNYRVAGRRYQQLLCTSELWQFTRMAVPIDNVSGLFQVTCIPANWGYRIMCRVA